jgi:hypothetical protein
MTNTEEFARALAEQLTTVWYDPKRNQGTAQVPMVGTITFREAGNDPAVIVQITQAGRFKGSAESAAQFLEKLSKAWGNSD